MNAREADIEQARRRVSDLNARIEGYNVGDRPMSPPVALLRELYAAEDRLRELLVLERRSKAASNLTRGALYLLGEQTVVLSRISGTGFAVVHPPGEPDMQSSWAVEPSQLREKQ